MRPCPDREVATHARLTGENAAVLDVRGAGQSYLSHDQTELPNATVVADLNQVVDFRSRADHGVVDASAVDSGVRSDLHIVPDDTSPDMRDLRVLSVSEHVAEPVRPDNRPGMDSHSRSDLRSAVDGDVRINPRSVADANPVPYYSMGADPYPITEEHAAPDYRVLVEGYSASDGCTTPDSSALVNRGRSIGLRIKPGQER